jgi:hypothetical protein
MSAYRTPAIVDPEPKEPRFRAVIRPMVGAIHDALVWLHARVAPKKPMTADEILQELLDRIDEEHDGHRG